MNIFYIDPIPEIAARYHANKHVVKMILETAQLLSTAWHVHQPEIAEKMPIYKSTHLNHPSTRWVRHNPTTYNWAWNLGKELCKEYTYRYDRRHKTEDVIDVLETPPFSIDYDTEWVEPFQAMPYKYLNESSLKAYRDYYKYGKAHLLTYTGREPPKWLDGLGISIPKKIRDVKLENHPVRNSIPLQRY